MNVKIYVWPDKTWASEEDIDDMDWFLCSTGKSDDYEEYEISADLDPEDIEELISLNALPGMLPDIPKGIEEMGKIAIPENSILIVHHSKDIDYQAVTILEDRMIVNAPNTYVEVVSPREKNE